MAEEKKKQPTATAPEADEGADAPADKPSDGTPKQDRRVKIKPELDDATREALALRAAIKKRTPEFRRAEWFRYKKLSRSGWRRPYGLHSKQRRHFGYRPNVVSIGYGGPKSVRGLHPSGFREVRVHNVNDVEQLDPKTEAARIAGSVGSRKREAIEAAAERLKIRILNPLQRRGDEE